MTYALIIWFWYGVSAHGNWFSAPSKTHEYFSAVPGKADPKTRCEKALAAWKKSSDTWYSKDGQCLLVDGENNETR